MVHPHTEIVDPLIKHQWLAKSALVRDLPECITSMSLPNESVVNDFEERACDFLAYQVKKKPFWKGVYSCDFIEGLLQSVLTSVWSVGNNFHHISNSHITLKPNLETYWRRNGENYISRTQPLFVLHTESGLGLFCDMNFIGDGLSPVQYTPLHLGLFKRSFDQILPFGGCRRFAPFSMAHTTFMIEQKNCTPEQLYTHGLIQLFSQSAAEAVQNGIKIDDDLPYPLVTQGIVTNGKKFTFVCFQLNTLNLQKDSADEKSNVFWAGPILDLFDSVDVGKGLVNFNRSCAELIIKFVLHKPVRKRPRQWGGQGRAMAVYKVPTDGQQLSPLSQSIKVDE